MGWINQLPATGQETRYRSFSTEQDQITDGSQIRMIGKGSAGQAAMMAAALNAENYVLMLDWFVPKILQHFDIPDIAAVICPRPVWVIDAMDGEGVVLAESSTRECYSRRISPASAALKGLHIQTTAEKDSEVYLDWLKQS